MIRVGKLSPKRVLMFLVLSLIGTSKLFNVLKGTPLERELRGLFPKLCVDWIDDELGIGDWRKPICRTLPRLVLSI
jgi:hypothetical protein